MRTSLTVTALLFAAASPAFAAAAAPDATGLVGTTWALDCKQPVSSTNYYLRYTIAADGRLMETLESNRKQERKLRNIQIMSKDWLLYTMDDNDGEAVNIVTFTDEQGRKKTWWSVGNSGKAYVVDGKFPDQNGGPPWFTQCK
jgi:hypothetical protein